MRGWQRYNGDDAGAQDGRILPARRKSPLMFWVSEGDIKPLTSSDAARIKRNKGTRCLNLFLSFPLRSAKRWSTASCQLDACFEEGDGRRAALTNTCCSFSLQSKITLTSQTINSAWGLIASALKSRYS